eukprot:gene30441-35451_t
MVYSSQFQPDIKHFVLFLACVPACFALLMSVFVNLVPHEYHEVSLTGMSSEEVAVLPHNQRPPHIPRGLFHMSKATRFLMVYILVAVMAVYGMVSSVWSSEHHLDSEVRQIISGILLALLSIMLLVPIAVGPCTYPRRRLHSQRSIMQIQADASSPLLRSEQGEAGVEEAMSSTEHGKLERSSSGFSECSTDFNDTLPPVEMGPLQAATCLSFWLIFYSYAIGVGTVPQVSNSNKHEMSNEVCVYTCTTLCGKPGGQVVHVALFSVANASVANDSGRLLNVYISENFLHKHGRLLNVYISENFLHKHGRLLNVYISENFLHKHGRLLNVYISENFLHKHGYQPHKLPTLGRLLNVYISEYFLHKHGRLLNVYISENFLHKHGRLLNGYISEYFLHKHGTNRTNFLSAVAILMTMVAAAGLCISDKGDLYSMSLLGGLAFGGFWSVIPAIVSDLFGLASFASNYTVLQLAPACGGYILATALSSYEYAKAVFCSMGQPGEAPKNKAHS